MTLPVNELSAASSNVSVTFFMRLPPPASDISTVFAPVGPTSSMSMALGDPWLRLVTIIVTLLTEPTRPVTVIEDGYGVAGLLSTMVMGKGLVNVVVELPSRNGKV